MKKHIVTIGGGSGQPELLRYLKAYDVMITAIVTMMDNGGSSGVLRTQRGVLPPGDIRKCMIALAKDSDALDQEWNARDENGHAHGNLVLLDHLAKGNSWSETIEYFSNYYELHGRVLPVTEEDTHLVAHLENGQIIRGEEQIDTPQHDTSLSIVDIAVDPPVQTTAAVREAIATADMVVLTMGDLYTSVIPNLLVAGVNEALAECGAPIVYLCNRTSKQGETHGFTTADYVRTLNRYLAPARITHVIVDDATIAPLQELAVAYEDIDDVTIIRTDLGNAHHPQYVSGKKAARAIIQLCTS